MRKAWFLLAALGIVLSCVPARAAEFIWDRTPYSSGLYMVGPIVAGDYDRFVAALRQRGPQYFQLNLRSEGGVTDEAMRIGRLVRRLSVVTIAPPLNLANTNETSCAADTIAIGRAPHCICASACTLIWFAGVLRTGGEIYVHSIKYDAQMFGNLSPVEAEQKYRAGMDVIHDYLRSMDVDDKIYRMMTEVASSHLQKVSVIAGGEIANESPGYREWLYARCGPHALTVEWGRCTGNAGIDATVEALTKFLATGQ